MKKNDLVKQVNFFTSAHRKSGQPINIYYPRKHFPSTDIQALRKRLNAVCFDVQSRTIIEHDALLIFDLKVPEDLKIVEVL